MFNKIVIQDVPKQVLTELETLAGLHDRSLEAEARQALRAWAEPPSATMNRNSRRSGIAARLNHVLQQENAARQAAKLVPSHIAEAIGEARGEDVEDWFLGEKEPGFTQLSAIAHFLGVDPAWLKHGDRTPYPCEWQRLPENPFDAVDWLLRWEDTASQVHAKVRALHLIRAVKATGGLYVVKVSGQGQFRAYSTPIHVSEEIGAGGEAALAALFVTLELLYKRRIACGAGLEVHGYMMHTEDIALLMQGNTHPALLLKDGARSAWWQDIWDAQRVPRHGYWEGWKSLHERIERVIAAREDLNRLRAQIRHGATSRQAIPGA